MNSKSLKDANQNPWYVLMTLHGEQDGDDINWELHKANRNTWNDIMSNSIPNSAADQFKSNGLPLPVRTKFHDVAKKVGQTFSDVWRERNGDWQPDMPMPRLDKVVEMRDILFSHYFVTTGMAFGKNFNINGAHFKKGVHLNNCGFADALFAEEATFGGNLDLGSSIVRGGLYLQNATLDGALLAEEAVVDGDCVLECKSLSKGVNMNGVRVGGNFSMKGLPLYGVLDAEKAEFRGEFNSDAAIIHGKADFVSAVFKHTARFVGAEFQKHVSFASASFEGDAVFRNAKFLAPADFPVVSFQGYADFTEAKFQSEVSCTLAAVRFEGATFHKFTSFRRCRFLTEYPDFFGATLYDRTGFTAESDFWPSVRQENNSQAKEACSVIRHVAVKQSLPEDEHFFFRREMHHAARAQPWYRTAHIYAYEVLSNFGYSIMRPLGWIVLVWTIGAWGYAIGAAMGWGTGAAYSFATMFKFFGFQRTFLQKETGKLDAIAGMEMFAAGQTVLGFILMFFLGLGLRTRFRLR